MQPRLSTYSGIHFLRHNILSFIYRERNAIHRKVHADAVVGKELSCVHCEPDDQIISQPSLTKAIRSLEEEYNVQLLKNT